MNLLSVKDLSYSQIQNLLNEADYISNGLSSNVDFSHLARGKVLGIIKDEGSTRTRTSFEVGMKRLGGEVVLLDLNSGTSMSKGETIQDTVRILSGYVDVIVMRHSVKGEVNNCAEFSSVPLINAGDGNGEHPTQALLDIYTIWKECKELYKLNIMLTGDLKNSRTVHSLLQLLSIFSSYSVVHLVAPDDMQLPDSYKLSNIKFKYYKNLNNALSQCENLDVLYMTRLQRERVEEDYYDILSYNHNCLLDSDCINKLGNCLVMHPLPRLNEIPQYFDKDKRAIYFKQAKNGMYVRMALLNNILNEKDFFARNLNNTCLENG